MIRLPTAALAALRNRLAERGARASLLPRGAGTEDELLEQSILEEYGPLSDAMYLMMAADGELSGAERDVIRGALRELDDRVRSRHVEALLAASAESLQRAGRDACYAALGEALAGDTTRAEAALLLAAAVAYADGEIAGAEDAAMAELMRVLGVDAARMRSLVTSLSRMDAVLSSDAAADPADVVVHAAMHLRTPEDFERLAAKTERQDVTIALRLFGAYAHAMDDLRDQAMHPASLPAACVAALGKLAAALPEGRSPRLDQLRSALGELVAALERVSSATGLVALVDEADGPAPIRALEAALARLSEHAVKALARTSSARAAAWADHDLRGAIGDVCSGRLPQDQARDALSAVVDATRSSAAATIPPSVLATVGLVLGRLAGMPTEGAEASRPRAEKTLPEWLPESRKLGGFRVLAPLGTGGTASVFVAVRADEEGEQAERYALKVPQYDALAARSVSESEYLSVFKREAGALLALPEHPNIAGFVTFDARARPKPLLVMELVSGVDCHTLVKRRALDAARVFDVLDGVLSGLSVMHEAGIGHLDVKPSNVVLREDGTAVLVDFGLAGRRLRVGCATPSYASPEVWGLSDEDATPFSADVYSFGCLAFELLTGRMLFESPQPLAVFSLHIQHDGEPPPVRALLETQPLADVARLVSRCLRKRAKDRPSVDVIREALSALRPSATGLPWPIDRRRLPASSRARTCAVGGAPSASSAAAAGLRASRAAGAAPLASLRSSAGAAA